MSPSWVTSGLESVLLPSGYQVRLVVPDLRRLARKGILSAHLYEVAVSATDDKGKPTEVPEAERDERNREYGDILAAEICWAVRESGPMDGELEPTTLTAKDIETLDGDDLAVLENVVSGEWSPERASRYSRIVLGLEAGEESDGEDLAGYAGFRGGPDGDASGIGGGALPDPPESDAADTESDDGVRSGRSPGHPPLGGDGESSRAGDEAVEGGEAAGHEAPEGREVRDSVGPRAGVT